MIAIVLLLLTSDRSFAQTAFKEHVSASVSLAWYRERTLKNISLGSLLVLTAVRAITANVSKLKDLYVREDAAAGAATTAPPGCCCYCYYCSTATHAPPPAHSRSTATN